MEDSRGSEKRYRLGRGTQVREEDFGLLFYTMAGPRLYFLSSGNTLNPSFFDGEHTLEQCVVAGAGGVSVSVKKLQSLKNCLRSLAEKGVILEC